MSDIKLTWQPARLVADLDFTIGDLVTGIDIEQAVIVSLFSDRRADPDFKPTDGTQDRRGWWGDTSRRSPLGSRLWTLERAVKSAKRPILLEARDYAKEALAWLIEDGLAQRVDVRTEWVSPTMLGIEVTITQPDGTRRQPFRYSWTWK